MSPRRKLGREILEVGVNEDIAQRQLNAELEIYAGNEFCGFQGISAGRKKVYLLGSFLSAQDVPPNSAQPTAGFLSIC